MEKLFKPAILIALCVLVSSCSPDKKVDENLTYRVFEPIEPGLAAQFGDHKITEEELVRRSGYLRDIKQKKFHIQMALMHRLAVEKLGEDKKIHKLKFYIPAPQGGMERVLANLGFLPVENIKVEFEDPTKIGANKKIAPANKSITRLRAEYDGQLWPPKGYVFNHLALYQAQKSEFQERVKLIERLFIRRHIFNSARKAGMKPEEFIQKNVLKGGQSFSEKGFNEYMDRSIPKGEKVDADLRQRLSDLYKSSLREEQQKVYAQEVFLKTPYKIFFSPPQPRLQIDTSLQPLAGRKAAPINIQVFGDFDCGDCLELTTNLLATQKKHAYDLNLSFSQSFPEWKRNSKMVAEAAMCVMDQSDKKFWNFIGDFAENPTTDYGEQTITSKVTNLGVDAEKFKECYYSRKNKDEVQAQLDYSTYLGVRRQPTLVVAGQVLSGPKAFAAARELIASELQNLGWMHKVKRFFYNLFN